MDRRPWTEQVHNILSNQQIQKLVAKYGIKRWPLISQKLSSQTNYERTGKQCRQRWHNHLNPSISNAEWSEQDEKKLFEAHKVYGNKWKIISKEFVGRTDNSIKNHFYSTIRRCLRRINKLQGQKNSTHKMRNIKPHVLSQILADKNLTERILQLGKIKPNKYRCQYEVKLNIEQLNGVLNKICEIGEIKKQNIQIWQQEKTIKQNRNANLMIQNQNKKEEQQIQVKRQQVTKKQKKKKQKRHNKQQQQILPYLEKGSRRDRKTKSINYYKLNQGILCQSQRIQNQQCANIQDTLMSNNKYQDKQDQNSQILSQIMQDASQQQQDQYNYESFLGNDHFQNKFKNMDIHQPSPAYSIRRNNLFDDLIIIGTQFKMTPGATPRVQNNYFFDSVQNQRRRRQSEDEFIQQILQINFDPVEAFKVQQQQI